MAIPAAPALAERLARLIRHAGPLPVSTYMAEAVSHYYGTRDPFGASGDFVTAPEISQMFGELLGLWAAQTWMSMGCPEPVALVELGPGRGTLMQDGLRAAGRAAPAFRAALRPHLVETSPSLRDMQARRLAGAGAVWHSDLGAVPDMPAVMLANEFLDALPIRQFVRLGDGWHERLVGLDRNGRLEFVLAPEPVMVEMLRRPRFAAAPIGAIAEIGQAGQSLVGEIGRRVTAHGGAALIVDYGAPDGGLGDSLQAVRGHRFHPPLEAPGEADLTAHVDFAALAEAARAAGAVTFGPVPQGAFLQRLGIERRAEALAAARPDQASAVTAALRRLTDPDAMGTLFQVLAIAAPDLPAPAGFEAPP